MSKTNKLHTLKSQFKMTKKGSIILLITADKVDLYHILFTQNKTQIK